MNCVPHAQRAPYRENTGQSRSMISPLPQAHRAAGEERRRRLAISLATLSRKPSKRADVVAHGGVAALIKLSLSDETRTRCSCAQVRLHKQRNYSPERTAINAYDMTLW